MSSIEERLAILEAKTENMKEDISEVKVDVKTVREVCDNLRDLTTELSILNQANSRIVEEIRTNSDRVNWLIVGTIVAFILGKILNLF